MILKMASAFHMGHVIDTLALHHCHISATLYIFYILFFFNYYYLLLLIFKLRILQKKMRLIVPQFHQDYN